MTACCPPPTLYPGDANVAGTPGGSPEDPFHSNSRGQNNNQTGFFVDDIIVGFAQRGELITAATGDTNFDQLPTNSISEISSGYYQFSVHQATPYGTYQPGFNPTVSLTTLRALTMTAWGT